MMAVSPKKNMNAAVVRFKESTLGFLGFGSDGFSR